MHKNIDYFRKYLIDPKILESLQADDPLAVKIPEWWCRVLKADGNERIRITLQEWEAYQTQLPAVFDFLSAHLVSVNLLVDQTSIRLLYTLEKDGQTMYYVGGNPVGKVMSPSVQNAWIKLPTDFKRFYESLHNGWYYLSSNSLGPSPVEDFFILDDLEWGILESIGDPGCDLKKPAGGLLQRRGFLCRVEYRTRVRLRRRVVVERHAPSPEH